MNRQTIIEIAKQIVMDMDYDPGFQINSFAMVDNGINLKAPAFGKTYLDYTEGKFFSRTWVNQGADPDKIQGEFPLLFMEQRSVEMDCIDDDTINYPFWFVLVDKISCDACPPEMVRSSDQVMSNTLIMLRRFFRELLTYRHYEYIKDGETYKMWATEGRINFLLEDGQIDEIITFTEDFDSLLQSSNKKKVSQWGNYENIRGHSTILNITVCDPEDGGYFKYNKTSVNEIAHAKCTTC